VPRPVEAAVACGNARCGRERSRRARDPPRGRNRRMVSL